MGEKDGSQGRGKTGENRRGVRKGEAAKEATPVRVQHPFRKQPSGLHSIHFIEEGQNLIRREIQGLKKG